MGRTWLLALLLGIVSGQGPDGDYGDYSADSPTTPFNQPLTSVSAVQQPAGSLYFPAPLTVYPDVTFVGNGGCSPSSLYDFLTVSNITIPTLEQQHLGLHLYSAQSSTSSPIPLLENIVYMDLQTGRFITASGNLNFSTQLQTYNYTAYGPNLVDYANYVALLNATLTRVVGLNQGRANNACAQGDSRLASLVTFLQAAQQNVSNPARINNGTTPTETWLPTDCILEQDANYEGTTVSGVLLPAAGQSQTANDCCRLCKASKSCNVFTFCGIQQGCVYGANQTFPYQGCQLKNQPGSSLSPLYVPLAYSRGPPTPFSSDSSLLAPKTRGVRHVWPLTSKQGLNKPEASVGEGTIL